MPVPGGSPPRQQDLQGVLRDLQNRVRGLESVVGGRDLSSSDVSDLQTQISSLQTTVDGLQANVISLETIDASPGTGSLRTLGTGAYQALPGNFGAPCYMSLVGAIQSIPANTGGAYVKVAFDTVSAGYGVNATSIDPANQFDAANSRFVAAADGTYVCLFFVRWSTQPSNAYLAGVVLKDSTDIAGGNGYWGPWGDVATGYGGTLGFTMVPLQASQYIELVVWHDSSTNFSLQNGQDSTYMIVWRVAGLP